MENSNTNGLSEMERICKLHKEIVEMLTENEPHIAMGAIGLTAAAMIKTFEDLGKKGSLEAFFDLVKDFKGKIDFIIGNGLQGDN